MCVLMSGGYPAVSFLSDIDAIPVISTLILPVYYPKGPLYKTVERVAMVLAGWSIVAKVDTRTKPLMNEEEQKRVQRVMQDVRRRLELREMELEQKRRMLELEEREIAANYEDGVQDCSAEAFRLGLDAA